MDVLNACPKCGDTEKGYRYNVPCVDERVGEWGQASESVHIHWKSWPTYVRCDNCSARVPMKAADVICQTARP